jgi:hypothetical protein
MNVSRSGFQNCPAPESTIDIFPLPNTWLNEQAAIKNLNRLRCKGKMQRPETRNLLREARTPLPNAGD